MTITSLMPSLGELPLLTWGIGGTAAILGGALALGIRHGIDWDHIAAITDITSTTTTDPATREQLLSSEPGVQLTDERHHALIARQHVPSAQSLGGGRSVQTAATPRGGTAVLTRPEASSFVQEQRRSILLGTLYALGHGSVVIALGLLAIIASEVLPGWVDPLMERVVGGTLIFLAVYLFYSLYRYFRSGEEFRIRSRWMVVFAAVGNLYHRLTAKLSGQQRHHHIDPNQQYGGRAAFGIGMIHGVGAETGTQVLIIATAVGAGSKAMSVVTLFTFVVGILVSNSFVTIATATGFISARRRQTIYVAVGVIAAVFSLIVGLVFLFGSADLLPNLDRYFHWIGGPSA